MIPAPIMLVDTLNTAPETDAGFIGGFISGRRGTCSGGGDIADGEVNTKMKNGERKRKKSYLLYEGCESCGKSNWPNCPYRVRVLDGDRVVKQG